MIHHHPHPHPQHHPMAELLFDYATGAMAEGRALAVAAHLGLCAACRAEVGRYEAVGGTLLRDAAPDADGDDALLQATLRRLDEAAPVEAAPRPLDSRTRAALPSPVWPYVAGGIDALRWKSVGIGVREAVLPIEGSGHRVSLLRIAAGRAIAKHTHGGEELTLVLAGGFSDRGDHYARGDFALADPSDEHRPVADPDGECLCLAVTEAPMRLTGLVGRLIAPFLKT
jgi:putative transcriptional regulator